MRKTSAENIRNACREVNKVWVIIRRSVKSKSTCAGLLCLLAVAHVCRAEDLVPPDVAPNSNFTWSVPDIGKLPDNDWGRTVRYGRDLIANTASLIGPEVKDPARRFAGNNLNCQSCHISAGTVEFGIPFVGVLAEFPSYRARLGTVGTMEDRIQGCMERSMNGKPLPADGPEMIAIVSYMKFLSTGRPIGEATPGRRAGRMPEPPIPSAERQSTKTIAPPVTVPMDWASASVKSETPKAISFPHSGVRTATTTAPA